MYRIYMTLNRHLSEFKEADDDGTLVIKRDKQMLTCINETQKRKIKHLGTDCMK